MDNEKTNKLHEAGEKMDIGGQRCDFVRRDVKDLEIVEYACLSWKCSQLVRAVCELLKLIYSKN